MKKLIPAIAALLISISACFSLMAQDCNSQLMNYALSKLGKKVGNGVCHELIDSAALTISKPLMYSIGRGEYGKRIRKSKAKPGDIVYEISHIGLFVGYDKDGGMIIINQNVHKGKHYTTYKDSRVVYFTYDKSYIKYLKIYRIYRN